jgi:hypothetical protein
MPRGQRTFDVTTLQMALVGYEAEIEKIENKIREIRSQLNGAAVPAVTATPKAAGGRRKLSAGARARIAAAQKKRWAEYHKKEGKG